MQSAPAGGNADSVFQRINPPRDVQSRAVPKKRYFDTLCPGLYDARPMFDGLADDPLRLTDRRLVARVGLQACRGWWKCARTTSAGGHLTGCGSADEGARGSAARSRRCKSFVATAAAFRGSAR